MGHYDNCYEADAEAEYEKEVKFHKEEISKSIDKMDISELKFLSDIATNVGKYRTFFKILTKHAK